MELKYNSLKEFKKDYPNEYQSLYRKKLLEKLCEDMGWDLPEQKKTPKPYGYWTKERCLEEALKYTTKAEWSKNGNGSHTTAIRNSWYNECTTHMVELQKPKGYWTLERCMEEALKYKTKSEWAKNSSSTYYSAKKNGSYNECTKHMVKLQKPKGYWTLETCLEEALKYETSNEWKEKNGASYQGAVYGKFLDKCTLHMGYKRLQAGYWNKERCLEEAKKYNGRFEWQKFSNSSYGSARKNGWLNECAAHMKILKKKLD